MSLLKLPGDNLLDGATFNLYPCGACVSWHVIAPGIFAILTLSTGPSTRTVADLGWYSQPQIKESPKDNASGSIESTLLTVPCRFQLKRLYVPFESLHFAPIWKLAGHPLCSTKSGLSLVRSSVYSTLLCSPEGIAKLSIFGRTQSHDVPNPSIWTVPVL